MVAEVLETILEVPENQPPQLTEEKIYQLIQHLQNDCYEGL